MVGIGTQTPNITQNKFFVVGRHSFTHVQEILLQSVGLTQEVGRIATVTSVAEVIEKAKASGASAIVIQALPLPLLAQLLPLASRNNIEVYGFRTEPVGIFKDKSEAEKAGDVVIPSREGGWRVLKTVALQRIKRIVVEAEDVAIIEG